MPLKINAPTTAPPSHLPDLSASSAFIANNNSIYHQQSIPRRPASPVAPAYSPITPKAQPALPVTYQGNGSGIVRPPSATANTTSQSAYQYQFHQQQQQPQRQQTSIAPPPPSYKSTLEQPSPQNRQLMPQHDGVLQAERVPQIAQQIQPQLQPQPQPRQQQAQTQPQPLVQPQSQTQLKPQQQTQSEQRSAQDQPKSNIKPTQFIPQPPSLPFSGEDATDALALRAAISSLQLQKHRAQNDLKQLEKIRKLALADPQHFRHELVAGKLKESKDRTGTFEQVEDYDEEDDDDESDEDEVRGPSNIVNGANDSNTIPDRDSQRSEHSQDKKPPFPKIPGPQNVVRMPQINWDKYHITGGPLDQMHEQQQRWPGNTAYGTSYRGREDVIAAPYSPFEDQLADTVAGSGGRDSKKTSLGVSPVMATSPNDPFAKDISEHPMETRRGSSRPH